MAVDKVKGTQLYIKVGNGATPTETFTHPCLINGNRGVQFQSSTNDIVIPDCDNPDDPAFVEVLKDALSMMVDGAGKLDRAAVSSYTDWWKSKDTKNVQVWLGTHGYWQAAMHLANFAITGARNEYCEATVQLKSSGTVSGYTTA